MHYFQHLDKSWEGHNGQNKCLASYLERKLELLKWEEKKGVFAEAMNKLDLERKKEHVRLK